MKNLEHIVDIGSLDEVIDILAPDSERDEYGGEKVTYRHVARVMGSFTQESGSENEDAEQITGKKKAKIVMRYIPGLTYKHRIVRMLDMTDWNIKGIQDSGRKRFHHLEVSNVETPN